MNRLLFGLSPIILLGTGYALGSFLQAIWGEEIGFSDTSFFKSIWSLIGIAIGYLAYGMIIMGFVMMGIIFLLHFTLPIED